MGADTEGRLRCELFATPLWGLFLTARTRPPTGTGWSLPRLGRVSFWSRAWSLGRIPTNKLEVTSKQNYLRVGFSLFATAFTDSVTIYFIFAFAAMNLVTYYLSIASRYFSNSEKDSLLQPSNFPYSSPFFWMASLVRWMNLLSRFLRLYSLLVVRIYP